MKHIITTIIAIATLSVSRAFAEPELTPEQHAAVGMSYLETVDSIVTKYSSAETVNLSGLRPEALA